MQKMLNLALSQSISTIPEIDLSDAESSLHFSSTTLNDDEKRKILSSYRLLDTEQEDAFDNIVKEATKVCKVPAAMLILHDSDNSWIQSTSGIDMEAGKTVYHVYSDALSETADVLVVTDVSQNDADQTTGYQFFAGAHLFSPEGPVLGTLCIMDTQVRPQGLCEREQQRLCALAKEVVYSLILDS
jgi:hypothetical protein